MPSPAVRGIPGDAWADLVIGKNDFNQAVPNQVVAWKLLNPGGVIVDRNKKPNRVYVYDGGNSRVLGYSSLGVCAADSSIACSVNSDCPLSNPQISNVAPAAFTNCSSELNSGWCSLVKDNKHGMCNNGEWATASQPTGFVKLSWSKSHKINKIVLYDRACPEQVLAGHITFSDGSENINFDALEGGGNVGTEINFSEKSVSWIEVWIDQSQGTNVGISEIEVYGYAEESIQKCNVQEGKPADLVLGQPEPQNYSGCNRDGNMEFYPYRKPASAETMCSNTETTVSPLESGYSAAMAVDNESNLYVPDTINNRVLKYIDPFATDRIADEVWGQKDFSGNRCNLTDDDLYQPGEPPPTADSLCIVTGTGMAGVDIDKDGNLWVADNKNSRVLRFSKQADGIIAKTADLVLGQPSFTTREWGNDSTHMDSPVAVQMDKETGAVYVSDSKNHRILVYKPPFTNGMAYSQTLGSGFSYPAGIMLDPAGEGLWVANNGNKMVELWDIQNPSSQPKKVLSKDTYQPNGQCGTTTANPVCSYPHVSGCLDIMCDVHGSFSFDSDNNLFVAVSSFTQDVFRFEAPIPTPQTGVLIAARNRLFYPPFGKNLQTSSNLWNAQDVLIANGQLIISDAVRILFWNNPDALVNGQPADGVAGVSTFEGSASPGFGGMTVDNDNHLFVTRGGRVDIFDLPLTFAEMPSRTLFDSTSTLPVLGGGTVSWTYDDTITGLDYDKAGNYLWFSHPMPKMSRVYRVRDVLTNPTIDVILGQVNLTSAYCNQDATDNAAVPKNPKPNSVCRPQNVKVDRQGNVWVSDHSLENEGNRRILMFDKEKFATISATALFGPDADLVSPETSPWKMGFDSQNRMAVGHNGYSGEEARYFISLYSNPSQTLKTTTTPNIMLRDFFSHGFASYFDDKDDLYVVDLNRGRMLKFLQPFGSITPSPTPTPTPPPPTLTPTITQVPQTKNITPLADTFVKVDSPNRNYGKEKVVNVEGKPLKIGFVMYDLSEFAGKNIFSAKFKIKVESYSKTLQTIKSVSDTNWNETSVTYNNRPAEADTITSFNPAARNLWMNIDLTQAVINNAGNRFSFAIVTTGDDKFAFYSKESSNKPQLEVTFN